MAKFKIDFGAEVDMLTQAELADTMKGLYSHHIEDASTERARGVKWMRLPVLSGTLSGTFPTSTTTLGGPGLCGPRAGYLWALRRLAAIGLSSATDQLYAYRNEAVPGQFMAALVGQGATNYASFTNVQAVLGPTDQLIIGPGVTFAAVGTIYVTGEAVEVPAELAWKVA